MVVEFFRLNDDMGRKYKEDLHFIKYSYCTQFTRPKNVLDLMSANTELFMVHIVKPQHLN